MSAAAELELQIYSSYLSSTSIILTIRGQKRTSFDPQRHRSSSYDVYLDMPWKHTNKEAIFTISAVLFPVCQHHQRIFRYTPYSRHQLEILHPSRGTSTDSLWPVHHITAGLRISTSSCKTSLYFIVSSGSESCISSSGDILRI